MLLETIKENGLLSRKGCLSALKTAKGIKILSKYNKAMTMKQKK